MKLIVVIITFSAFVFIGCSSPTPAAALYNNAASINSTDLLPENPLQWKVVTTLVNRNDSSMATLYGNDTAVNYARHHADGYYPAGAKLALVKWNQQDDKHWFGAKIPNTIASVEMIMFNTNDTPQYNRYEGSPLRVSSHPNTDRLAAILSYRAAVVPH
jgi:hypothetical protein